MKVGISMLTYLIAASFVLAFICLATWVTTLVPAAIATVESKDIAQLARLRILIAISCFGALNSVLLVTFLFIVVSTPVLNYRVSRFHSAMLVCFIAASALVPLYYRAFHSRLLYRWFPTLFCPYCEKEIVLIAPWACPGGCAPTMRHVLAACRTCNARLQGLECEDCGGQIVFADRYNEREVINRGKRHITVFDYYFISAALVLYFSLLLIYACWQSELTEGMYFFAVLAGSAIVVLIFRRPKRLIPNPHHSEGIVLWLNAKKG